MNVLQKIPPPGITVGGKTAGPAVSIGRSRVGRGQPLYLHESEVRELVAKFGWPLPEAHRKVKQELAAAEARVAELEQHVADQADAVAAAEAALKARFGEPAVVKPPVKHPRKPHVAAVPDGPKDAA